MVYFKEAKAAECFWNYYTHSLLSPLYSLFMVLKFPVSKQIFVFAEESDNVLVFVSIRGQVLINRITHMYPYRESVCMQKDFLTHEYALFDKILC